MTRQIPLSLDVFEKIPLFRGLNETECRQVGEIAQRREYAPGEVIIRQGQRSQDLWVLLEGKCEVAKLTNIDLPCSEALVLAELEPYNHFGEMSFFHSAPHSATVRAQTPVKLLKIIRGDYEELIQEGCRAAYKVAYNTVECLAERLRRMDEWVAELTTKVPAEGHVPTQRVLAPDGHVQEWSDFREKMLTNWNI